MALPILKQGDVVFTVDGRGTPMHLAITTAQRIGSPFKKGHANSVHCAIATGSGFDVFESVGSGLRRKSLKPGKYRIFRYKGANKDAIRRDAVQAAETFTALAELQLPPGYGKYNRRKGMLSPIQRSSKQASSGQQFGDGAKAHRRFYCSNMVWRCYMAAGELNPGTVAIPTAHSQLSPRDLEALLIKQQPSWEAKFGGHSMSHP